MDAVSKSEDDSIPEEAPSAILLGSHSENIWTSIPKGVKSISQTVSSPAFIPDKFKQNPSLFYTILAIIPLLLLLPLRWPVICFGIGIILGYIIGVPSLRVAEEGPLFPNWMEGLRQAILSPLRIKSKEHYEYAKLNISPAVDAELDGLLNALLTEVIDAWFVPLCMSGERDFQSCLRSVINASIMNFLRYGQAISSDTLTLIMYGLTNATIVHMEEFRAFEESRLPLDRFLKSGKTIRKHHQMFLDQLGHVKQIIALLLRRLLPKQESRSILVNALLKEVLSGNLLVGMIDKITDPDFINEMIVKHMGGTLLKLPELEPGYDLISIKGMIQVCVSLIKR